jgi:hypothetical protein
VHAPERSTRCLICRNFLSPQEPPGFRRQMYYEFQGLAFPGQTVSDAERRLISAKPRAEAIAATFRGASSDTRLDLIERYLSDVSHRRVRDAFFQAPRLLVRRPRRRPQRCRNNRSTCLPKPVLLEGRRLSTLLRGIAPELHFPLQLQFRASPEASPGRGTCTAQPVHLITRSVVLSVHQQDHPLEGQHLRELTAARF